jgi:PDZ domain-containing secreted protein
MNYIPHIIQIDENMGTFMNIVIGFGFILTAEQMIKLLSKFYTVKDKSNIKRWIEILEQNNENYENFCIQINKKSNSNLEIYFDCYAEGEVFFSVKTIYKACGEDLKESKNKILSLDKMQKIKQTKEQHMNKILNDNDISEVSCDWYTFVYKW